MLSAWILCQATAQTGPVRFANLSVNLFLPEAVIISRSLARVMPWKVARQSGQIQSLTQSVMAARLTTAM